MIVGKKTFFALLSGCTLLVNTLEFTHINFLYTTTLLAFCTFVLLPGVLLSLILHVSKVSLWEYVLFTIGFGLAFLELGGLLLNALLPVFGIDNPLALQNLLIGFDGYILLLLVFAWIRTKPFTTQIRLPRRSKFENVCYAVPLCFPVLAAFGAIVLNNGGSNILTLVLLGTIGSYSFLLVIYREKISVDLYPYALFFIAMACLFTTSLRSWFITGHDIEKEFYVFQLTNAHHLWSMALYQDAYNACLSITILPTELTNLLFVPAMYVYKVIFQVLFAISPVLVFFITRKYTIPIFAFLSAFFFLSFPLFFTDMPMINRQEIAFIFFGLAMYMMLTSESPLLMRRAMFILFTFFTALSHYSTYYILLSLMIVTYAITFILSLTFVKARVKNLVKSLHIPYDANFHRKNMFLTLPMILLLLVITYLWYSVYTHIFNNLTMVISTVISDEEIKPSDLSYYFFFPEDPNKQLQTYIQSLIASEKNDVGQRYDTAIVSKYSTRPLPQQVIALTPLGSALAALYIPMYKNQEAFRLFFTAFLQIFVLVIWLAAFSFMVSCLRSLKEKNLKEKMVGLLRRKTVVRVMEPKLSLKMGGASIKQTSQTLLAKDRQATLQSGNAAQHNGWTKKSSQLIQPKFSLKASVGLVEQASLASDKQAAANFHSIAAYLSYNTTRRAMEDIPTLKYHELVVNHKIFLERQFLFLCSSAIFLLVLMLVLPDISALFGVLRMTQQFLFILSLFIVLGIYSILFFLKDSKRILVTGIMMIILFFNFTGFIPHLTGGYYPQINLDNAGIYYDVYYVHKADILAIAWIAKHDTNHQPVEADASGANKMQTFGNIIASNEIFPPVILKDAYVYMENSLYLVVSVHNSLQIINAPQAFLDKNKNHIYSNGEINIYK